MYRFFFHIQPEPDLPRLQQQVHLWVLYALALTAVVVVPINLWIGRGEPVTLSLPFQLAFLAFMAGALVTFWASRSLRWARAVAGAGVFVLAAYLILDAGGTRGVGYLYFLATFSLLYLLMGLRGGLAFILLFALGIFLRVEGGPVPADSILADPETRSRLLLAFGVAAALGAFGVVYQHTLVRNLTRLAYRDEVTGLASRNRLVEDIDQAVRLGRPFALAALKLHHFGLVTNHLGMVQGDRALAITGQRIRDLLPSGALAGRWTGTFFLIRIPETRLEVLDDLGQALIHAVGQPVDLAEERLLLQTGVALTRFPEEGTTRDRLVANLSTTLGRGEDQPGQVLFYDDAAWKAEERKFHLAAALETALEAQQFSLAYQPKVTLADARPHGAEILLRWTHPELGPVSPAEFIPVAETLGIIHDITWWVIDQFLADAPRIADARGPGHHGPHALNLSTQDLNRRDLAEGLIEKFRRAGLPPTEAELEITEGVMMSQDPHVRQLLVDLKALGFRLAIDDFGTGYSSLSYLHRIEADTLKIDQSFVRQLGTGTAMTSIVDAVISLGKALDLDIVAEGVETQEQADYLAARGCNLAQGWLFSKPMPLEAYLEWLRARRRPPDPLPAR